MYHLFSAIALSILLTTFLSTGPALADDDYGRHGHRHHHVFRQCHHPFWRHAIGYEAPVAVVNRYYYADYAPPPALYPSAQNIPVPPRYCREYYRTANIGGYLRQTYGRACLQPDGSWEVVD